MPGRIPLGLDPGQRGTRQAQFVVAEDIVPTEIHMLGIAGFLDPKAGKDMTILVPENAT